MVFNATFNNISVISWRLVLLVEETGVPGVNLELAELVFIIGQILPNTHLYCKSLLFCFVYLDLVKSIYLSVSDIYCHSLFCLWVVSPLQCRSSILVFILFYTPRNEVVGGYTGFTMSDRLSVRPSVRL
jgi:hypothetical protein